MYVDNLEAKVVHNGDDVEALINLGESVKESDKLLIFALATSSSLLLWAWFFNGGSYRNHFLLIGNQKRHVGSTNMNEGSSRSHAILNIVSYTHQLKSGL